MHVPRPVSSPPRIAPVVASLAIVAVSAFGVYLSFVHQGPLGVDSWWHSIAHVQRGTAGYALAVFMAEVGTGLGAGVCAAVVAALFWVRGYPRGSVTVMTAMLLGVAGSTLIKTLVARPRPWDQMYSVSGSSYPSGHTMGAAALAVSVALVLAASGWITHQQGRLVWALAGAWIALMAWSRTALHVHWLSDTAAGALLGTAAALIAVQLWHPGRRSQPRDQANVAGSP